MPGKNLSRDPERTPMQWDNSEQAGFTTVKPWLRLDKTWMRDNVQVQRQDKYSMLSLYQRLIQLRQREPSLMTGNYQPVFSDHQMLAYIRHAGGSPAFLIVLNLTHRPCYFAPGNDRFKGEIIIDTYPELEETIVNDKIDLGGDEGVIVRLDEWQSISSNPNATDHHT